MHLPLQSHEDYSGSIPCVTTTAKEAYTGAGRLEQHEVVLTAAARVTP